MDEIETPITKTIERLRIAAEAVDMFGWEYDLDSNSVQWAPNAARVIGCQESQLTSDPANLGFYVDQLQRNSINDEIALAITEGRDKFSTELRNTTQDGVVTHWQVRGKLIPGATGKIQTVIGASQNVTTQKNSEKALREYANRLATAEEAAGVLTYDWNAATNKVWRSDGLTKILGWKPSEIDDTQEAWTSLRHPDDRERLKFSTVKSLPENDRYVFESRMLHKDGHYVWILDSGRIYRDESNNITHISGASVDISARKKVESSINLQANLIDLSFEPIFVWHPTKGIVEWNKGAEQLYGYDRKEALGQSSHQLLKTVSSQSPEQILDILKIGRSWTGELEHYSKDGRQIFVESRHQAIVSDGEMFILETNHDISQRKRADAYTARMAAVALSSHDALFGITVDGIIETWNPAAERLFGYSAEEAIGQNIRIVAEPSRYEEQRDLMRRAHTNETVGPYDAKRMRKDGTTIDVSVALAPVKSPDGQLKSISVSVHDISDRKEWEMRQRLMTRELAHRNKNSFAVLQGILRSTLRTAKNQEDFAEAFSGRLHSLSAAQDVLTANDWRGAEMSVLIKHQLAAYVANEDHRVELIGATVNLPAELAAPFGLIINELATNATKYGALSVETGSILVTWTIERSIDSTVKINLTWRERGGPKLTAPGPRGFGSTLIERSMGGAKTETIFEEEGLTFKMEMTFKSIANLRRSRRRK
jgi:PAS domain S-box-containing protein